MNMAHEGGVWFGTAESFQTYANAYRNLQDPAYMANVMALREDDQETSSSYLLSKMGNASVININGSLVNNDAWYNELFGLVSYAEIRRAVIDAVQDETTEAILLDPVYSGKGMAGLIDLCRKGFFKKGQNVVFLHTGGQAGLFGYADDFGFRSRKQMAA